MSSLHISAFAPCRLDMMLDQWLTRVSLRIPSLIQSRSSFPRIEIPYARVSRPIIYPSIHRDVRIVVDRVPYLVSAVSRFRGAALF